jgi:ABC-2 type transport system permease protein
MSTRTIALPSAAPAGRDDRPPLGRLIRVELRKMVDTRAGFWLLLTVVLVTVLVALAAAVGGREDDHQLRDFLNFTVAPSLLLLPVMGVLVVTSEWSQRTTLTTFALVPRRSRVLAAKVLASVALSVAAFAFCLAVSIVACATVAGETADAWSLPLGLAAQIAFYLAVSMVTGVAFGTALLHSAPAIVLYFVLPIAWSIVGAVITSLHTAADWLDGSKSLSPLTDHLLSGTEWARALTTLALWMVLPLLIGAARVVRGEVT